MPLWVEIRSANPEGAEWVVKYGGDFADILFTPAPSCNWEKIKVALPEDGKVFVKAKATTDPLKHQHVALENDTLKSRDEIQLSLSSIRYIILTWDTVFIKTKHPDIGPIWLGEPFYTEKETEVRPQNNSTGG